MKNVKVFGIGLLSLLVVLSFHVSAQPGDPPIPDDPVPLTGIEFLFAAGGALGGYKLLKKFRRGNSH